MSQAVASPVLPWTAERLQDLEPAELDGLARGAGRSLVVGRLLIGRCMLEMDRRDLAGEWGFSGSVHYAVRVLKISKKVARDARRVARELQGLPLLNEAAEQGDVGWAHLREVVRVATPDTESAWLDAMDYPWPAFFRMVKNADSGDLPGEGESDEQKSDETELRVRLSEDRRDLMQAALAKLARSFGRVLPIEEALDFAWAEILNGAEGGFEKKLEKAQQLLQEMKEIREREGRREAARARKRARQAERKAARAAAAEAERSAAAEGAPAEASAGPMPTESAEAAVPATAADATPVAAAECAPAPAPAPLAAPAAELAPEAASAAGAAEQGGPTWAAEAGSPQGAGGRVEERPASAGLPRPPFVYPEPVTDGADVLHDWELPYGEDLSPPWDMASATAVPYPGAQDLHLTVPERKPFWEGQHECCEHPHSNREARRAAAVERGAGTRRGSAETRRSVLRRDRFRCLCPDCPNSIWIHLHHLTMYCRGGASIPINEIALCSKCHRNVHKGRLRIHGSPEEGLEWLNGSGRPLGDTTEEVRRRSVEYAREILEAVGL